MSTNEKAVSSSETTVGSLDTTPNPYVDTAQTLLQTVRSMRDQIPRFVIPESRKAASRLSAVASVPREFVELTAVAMTNQKTLVRGDGATPAEMRDMVGYADAFDPLADELEAMAQFVRFSAMVARNTAGSEALMVYAVAQRLAKRRENADLVPHVADMRRALGRVRKLSPEAAAKKEAAKAALAAEKAAKAAGKVTAAK